MPTPEPCSARGCAAPRPRPRPARRTRQAESADCAGSSWGRLPAAPPNHDAERDPGQEQRPDEHVQDFERGAEVVDVAVQVAPDRAQLPADPDLLVQEALDLGLLLGAHQQRALVLAGRLQLAQLLLGFAELGLQLLLGVAEARVRVALQLLDPRKRPPEGGATPQTDEVG